MASPSTVTNSSGSSLLQNSVSGEDLKAVMDQRKRKRRISNRESARRSRMRKQQHLDDLNSQLHQLREDNAKVSASLSLIAQHYFEVEAENSVLKIQSMELGNRLMALNDILHCCLTGSNAVSRGAFLHQSMEAGRGFGGAKHASILTSEAQRRIFLY
ncbi:bZIP transcription factor 44-like [Curcuma longa]|uniref:bZIP transcription factor 44-like n=1 Tax=Curcuma longa TaxID=136217 RepID=UPI003D9E6B61